MQITTNQKVTLTAKALDAMLAEQDGEIEWTQNDDEKVVKLVAVADKPADRTAAARAASDGWGAAAPSELPRTDPATGRVIPVPAPIQPVAAPAPGDISNFPTSALSSPSTPFPGSPSTPFPGKPATLPAPGTPLQGKSIVVVPVALGNASITATAIRSQKRGVMHISVVSGDIATVEISAAAPEAYTAKERAEKLAAEADAKAAVAAKDAADAKAAAAAVRAEPVAKPVAVPPLPPTAVPPAPSVPA